MLGNKSNKQFYREGGARGGHDQFSWDKVKNDKVFSVLFLISFYCYCRIGFLIWVTLFVHL